jgi:alpha-L-rhamnosidase
MKKTIVLLTAGLALFLFHTGLCSVPQQKSDKTSGNQNLFGDAAWISGTSKIPEYDSLFYLDDPAPLLKSEFAIDESVEKAEMWITAAGYYETWLNGKRVGDRQLDPAWTNYAKRVYVAHLDVTSMVQKGNNSWGIILGNGFYNPLPLRMWGGRNIRKDLPVGNPCAIARMVVTLKNGSQVEFYTSDKWKTKPGPITRNNVYLGEWYDARKEVDNWNGVNSGFNGWDKAVVTNGPGGTCELSEFPPIRITRWLDPVSIKIAENRNRIIDFGQNCTALIRLKIHAEKGDTIRIRYGELLYPDGSVNPMTTVCGQIKRAGVGGPGAPAVAEQLDVYIAKGNGEEVFQPRFTFHGFRYAEISGLRQNLTNTDVKAGRISSAVENAGLINSSSTYLNQLNSTCQWTFLSNLQSVQSDCPAREKFGYGGDINATADAFIYNFDMQDIYRKMIFDWIDALKPDRFVDTAPSVGIEYCGLSWESAFMFLQDALLVHYGDYSLIKELYETDKTWMEKVAKIHPGFVVDNGLSDHESLAKVPVELTGTCHYYQLACIMERFAKVSGDKKGMVKYHELSLKIRERIIDLFWDTPSIEVPNQQTLLATLLVSGVLNSEEQKVALGRLLEVLKNADYHVTTGIFGTKYLLEVLSSHGRTDIAWRVVNQSGFPGWKYMIDNGATTLWETWKESDNTYSQNHPMFGSVSEWYIKWLGGIQPDMENPQITSVVLRPQPVSGLDSLHSEKFFQGGILVSSWKWEGTSLVMEFVIPDGINTSWLPAGDGAKVLNKYAPDGWKAARNKKTGKFNLDIPGRYVFEIPEYGKPAI